MNKRTKIAELMTKNLIVAGLESKLDTVLEFFSTYKVQHLPVAYNNKLLGILSINDVLDYMSSQILLNKASSIDDLKNNFKVNDIMTKELITISSKESIGDAINVLSKSSFQALPVLEDENLVGIVTKNDLVKYLGQL